MSSLLPALLLISIGLGGSIPAIDYRSPTMSLGSEESLLVRLFGEETSANQSKRDISRVGLRIVVSLQDPDAHRDASRVGEAGAPGESDGVRVCGEETSVKGNSACFPVGGTVPRLAGEDVSAEALSALEAIFSLDIAGYTLSIFLEG